MTPALQGLLRRIEAAGGPVRSQHSYGEWTAGDAGLGYPDNGTFDEPRRAQIVRALQLHAREHNARFVVTWEYEGPGIDTDEGWVCSAAVHRQHANGESTETDAYEGPDEASAYCLAWLAAFEQEEAA